MNDDTFLGERNLIKIRKDRLNAIRNDGPKNAVMIAPLKCNLVINNRGESIKESWELCLWYRVGCIRRQIAPASEESQMVPMKYGDLPEKIPDGFMQFYAPVDIF